MNIGTHRQRFTTATPTRQRAQGGSRIGGNFRTAIPTPPPPPALSLPGPAGLAGGPAALDPFGIFPSENNVAPNAKFKKTNPLELTDKTIRRRGTCAALSTLWLANMYTQTNPACTQPNQARAAFMFAKNWITKSGADRTYGNLDDAGLRETAFFTYHSLTQLFTDLAVYPGYYLIELSEGHYVAVVRRGIDAFLHDSNVYCYKFRYFQLPTIGVAKLTNSPQQWSDSQELWVSQVSLKS
jgi:hypothetical protein